MDQTRRNVLQEKANLKSAQGEHYQFFPEVKSLQKWMPGSVFEAPGGA